MLSGHRSALETTPRAHLRTRRGTRPGRRSRWTALTAVLVAVLAVHSVVLAPRAEAVATPSKLSATVEATLVQLDWEDVTDASGYEVQWATNTSFTAAKTTDVTGSKALVDQLKNGLSANTTYWFRVRALNGTDKSGWSTAVTAKPHTTVDAPTALQAENIGGTRVEVSWLGVLNASAYQVRTYNKATREVTWTPASGTYTTVTGLTKRTAYDIGVYAAQAASDGLPPILLSARSTQISVTTSSYELAAPSNLQLVKQAAKEVGLSWDAPTGMPADWKYKVQYALNSAMTNALTSAPPGTPTSMRLTGLRENTNYYARVLVVDEDGKQRSDRSTFVLAKTLVARGTLTGSVSGGSDLVAQAFTTGNDLAAQTNVGADGTYSLDVRPGVYRVRIAYVGNAEDRTNFFASRWAKRGTAGVMIASLATKVEVAYAATAKAPKVTIGAGSELKGTITDSVTGDPVADVNVVALSNESTEWQVIASSRTDKAGHYTLRGLLSGNYWIRMNYGDGFAIKSTRWTMKPDQATTFNAALAPSPYRKTYGAYVRGTARVKSTLTCQATPWLAGDYPTTTAKMSITWLRDGKVVATGSKRTLASADRGHLVACRATARKYGYVTGRVTSRSVRVS